VSDRVDGVEGLVKPEDVGRSYDQIAHQWSSDAFPRQSGIEAHRRALAFVQQAPIWRVEGRQPDGARFTAPLSERRRRALDIGCGCSGRFIDLLAAQDFVVEGLDISERMIELARMRHPAVTFHHADVGAWRFPRQYDLISAWDSIWHVALADQARVLTTLLEALAPGGVCVFTTGGVDAPGEHVDAVMGPPMYYAVPGLPRTLEVIAAAGCVCRHLEYDQYPELHVYVIAQRR
jgi:2-polyprenyl-3-methyl-5-hydroxy-6-metoxy-1,4-benzoquinol methylase